MNGTPDTPAAALAELRQLIGELPFEEFLAVEAVAVDIRNVLRQHPNSGEAALALVMLETAAGA